MEQIDLGEVEPRTIISGLRQYCKAEDLEVASLLSARGCNLSSLTVHIIKIT